MSHPYTWATSVPDLASERLLLRPLHDDDAPALFEVFSDPEVMRYWSSGPHKTHEDTRALIHRIRDGFARHTVFQWCVARRGDDLAIGTVTLLRFDVDHKRCEVGYVIGRAHWGQGLAREAVSRLTDFAFDELHLHRLEADVDPRNVRSIALLERLGWTREGLLRERYHVHGEVQDTAFLGLLRREWKPPTPAR